MAKDKKAGNPEWLDPDHHPFDESPRWLKKLRKEAVEEPPKDPPKKKRWFRVRLEGVAPVVVEFQAFAEDEDQAFEMVEKKSLGYVQMLEKPSVDIAKMKKSRVLIKDLTTGLINWVRKF